MDDLLWVLGFIARNVVQGFVIGAVATLVLWYMLKRGHKDDQ